VDRIKKNPLNRALRIDKMTLAALEATLRLYLEPEAARSRIPSLAMITAEPRDLEHRAGRLKQAVDGEAGDRLQARVIPGQSRVGGGAFPEYDLPTWLVAVEVPGSLEALRAALLDTEPPLVGRLEENRLLLDVRTLADDELELAARALVQALDHPGRTDREGGTESRG
jgi:L-seryl-tRNA(Ser) seleniumtransferase